MKRWSWIAAAALVLAGCASIVSGSKQSIAFSSAPPGAAVTVDAAKIGVTPVTVPLARKLEHDVTIELQGYKPYTVKLQKNLNGWFIGNVIFGGLIGIVVDASTGAMYKLTPGVVSAQLQGQVATTRKGDTLQVLVTLNPDPSWERVGQLQRASD